MSNNDTGNILILLALFATSFGANVGIITCNLSCNSIIDNSDDYQNLYHLLIVPIFIYLSYKSNDKLAKLIYLLAIFPFIFWSNMFYIMNVSLLNYLCIFIQAVLVGLSIRFIGNNIRHN